MSNPKEKVKTKNPEAALQASVARDIKLRLMDESVSRQNVHLAVARWENALGIKDVEADRKRSDESFHSDAMLQNKNLKRTRKQKLEALFKAEELQYEEELSMQGLAFRRIKA